MKRKINLVGQNTLTVSLPTKWAKRYNLKKGDEVEVSEEEKNIVLAPLNYKPEEKVCTIFVTKPKRLMSRKIFSLFRKGYNTIHINYDDPSVPKDIQRYITAMIGFDIISQKKNSCTIKNIARVDEENFDNMLRRLFLVTLSLAEESYEIIKAKDYHMLRDVAELEKTQNKIYLTCLRIITVKGHILFENPYCYYSIVERLEDIGDKYKYICTYINENFDKNYKLSKQTLDLFAQVNDMLRKYYEFFYNFNDENAVYLIKKKKTLIVPSLELLETVPKKEVRIVHSLIDAMRRIYEVAGAPTFGVWMKED